MPYLVCRHSVMSKLEGESEFVWKNREAVVGPPSCEIFQHLPGIRVRTDGRSPAAFCLSFIYNLRWRKMFLK